MAGRVRTFWRDVFDLSDRRDIPARARAGAQMYLVFGALGLLGYAAADLAWGASSLTAHLLATVTPILCGAALGSYLHLRRLRRRQQRRPRGDEAAARRSPRARP